jgi:formate hydrogenlyase subunit 6/NADH:ubiquinone oxidoreductase subunit I
MANRAGMRWTITRLCIDHLDKGCINICPVDCIYEYVGDKKDKFPNQLYIRPDECIDCGRCAPQYPWDAIYEEHAVPKIFDDDIMLNHMARFAPQDFRVAKMEHKERPTPEEVRANKLKWGLLAET